jgi:L-cysteine/cystine lyase
MNPETVRQFLNLSNYVISINAGSWGPLCKNAFEAIISGYEEESSSRGSNLQYMKSKVSGLSRYSQVILEAKDTLSQFLNCKTNEIALCDSTTTGMNIFLWGYNWKKGDQIVAGSLENPAAKVPLMVLARRHGVKLVFFDTLDSEDDLQEKITSNTRIVLISDVNFATGSRVNLSNLSKIAHDNEALLLADGIQAVGNHDVDVTKLGVDGYALASHKFLCGPDGAGSIYISEEMQDSIHPTYSGVFSDKYHGSGELMLMQSAQKYEVSTRALPVIKGGTAAIKWIMNDVGLNWIIEHTSRLYSKLWFLLSELSHIEMVSGKDQKSLMSFRVDGIEPDKIVEVLREHNIFTRPIGAIDPPIVRLSIGFWNRNSDIDKIFTVLESLS